MSKLDSLIKKFQEAREELTKNVNESYAGEPNTVNKGCHGEKLSLKKNGQWHLSKGECPTCKKDPCVCEVKKAGPENPEMGHSAFNMAHVHEVSAMKDHGAAKAHAHKIVDSSTANPENRAKLKAMINKSRNSAHLAQGMTNHILAHPSENLKVGRG